MVLNRCGSGIANERQETIMNQDNTKNKVDQNQAGKQGLLTTQEAADFLRVSTRHLWTITESGRIPRIKVRRCVRYKMDDLVRYIDGLRSDGMNKKKGAA